MDIAVFLSARWDEIEKVAKLAGGKSWHVAHDAYDPEDTRCKTGECWHRRIEGDDITIYDEGGHDEDQAAHIALHDPASVLADIASKRAILALHRPEPGQHPDFCGHDLRELPCPTLRLLAAPFASHDDFDPAWTVETTADDYPPPRSDLVEAILAAIPTDEHGQPETVWYSPVGELVFYAPPGVPARVERADPVVDIGLPWAEQVRIALTFDDGCICVGDDLRYRPVALVRGFTTSTSFTVRCRREMP